jgi:hypothetical protein
MSNFFNEISNLFTEKFNTEISLKKITKFLDEQEMDYLLLDNRSINIGKISSKILLFNYCSFISQTNIECDLAIFVHCKWNKLASNGDIIIVSDNIIGNIDTDKNIMLVGKVN